MRRGTTTVHTFRTSEDLTKATVFITYKQGGMTILEKTNADLTIAARKITLKLSQDDTLSFKAGQSVEVQMRYVKEDGTADASNVVTITVQNILKDGEIEYVAPESDEPENSNADDSSQGSESDTTGVPTETPEITDSPDEDSPNE